jgi:hypothetical protein
MSLADLTWPPKQSNDHESMNAPGLMLTTPSRPPKVKVCVFGSAPSSGAQLQISKVMSLFLSIQSRNWSWFEKSVKKKLGASDADTQFLFICYARS